MSEHVLSILVKAIGATKAAADIKGVDSALGNLGARARAGAGVAAGNIARIGAVAAVGLAGLIKTGIDDLATLEDATTKVDGAIRQMGESGKVTAVEVAGWANKIEADIGAAFDDKAITAATATLIRFGSVTPANLRPAMVVMTDLAAKTGDVDSAATLLAKALADPTKAAGRLARAGVVLTKSQQDQIKALQAAGKTEQAQALLLDLISAKTAGAAAATQGPYRRALSTLRDVSEDARKALAEGFLPVLERVSGFLKKKLADPQTITEIRGFGTGLADAFDKVLSLAGKVPWDSIASAMKISGMAAKGILDAFVAMPPWVQTAIVTGWGLNKLTGGALGGIVGEIGKGLIHGVLGMNAGVVNIKAGAVTGGGVVPGASGGGLGTLGKVALVGEAIGLVAAVEGVRETISADNSKIASGLQQQTAEYLAHNPSKADLQNSLGAVEQGIDKLRSNPLNVLVQGDALDKLTQMRADIAAQLYAMGQIPAAVAAAAAAAIAHDPKAAEASRQFDAGANQGFNDQSPAMIAAFSAQAQALAKLHSDFLSQIGALRRLPDRGFASRGFALEHQILRSHESARNKIADLTGIQRAFMNRGDTHSAAKIGRDLAAVRATIAHKKLSVTVKNTVLAKTTFSVRDVMAQQVRVAIGANTSNITGSLSWD